MSVWPAKRIKVNHIRANHIKVRRIKVRGIKVKRKVSATAAVRWVILREGGNDPEHANF